MAWFSTVLLAVGSAGILTYALLLTRRLFRAETDPRDDGPAPGTAPAPSRTEVTQ